MPDRFFSGQVRLLLKRCRTLRSHLNSRSGLPDELHPYVRMFDAVLENTEQEIGALLADPDFGAEQLLKNQFEQYKRCSEVVNLWEWYPLELLDRYGGADHYFFKFAKLFCEQVRYPGRTPLMSAHSNEYFLAQPVVGQISVPLCEDRFLLALPDFVHELGHLYFFGQRAGELERSFGGELDAYIRRRKERLTEEASSEKYRDLFDSLGQIWMQRYVIEFSCDMFATYLVGPAFGWSHMRLVLGTGTELHRPGFGEEETHPSDESRMRAILLTIEKLGRPDDASELAAEWDEYKGVLGERPDEEYAYCYPDSLLGALARSVIRSCHDAGLLPYHQHSVAALPSLMSEAWIEFRRDPDAYVEWETEKTLELKSSLI